MPAFERETTCKEVVEAYIARASAYNGICTMPVTDGRRDSPEGPRRGPRRRAGDVSHRDRWRSTSSFPDFENYAGFRPDYGRMEPTMSDPSVYQQYGMVVGIPNAGQ